MEIFVKRAEFVFFAGVSVFCALYLAWALRMPFGGVRNPGPGFFPVILGLTGVAIALGFVVKALVEGRMVRGAPLPKAALARLAGYIVTIGLYAATQSIVGTYVGIFVLVLVLSKLSGLGGWTKPVALAGGCAAAAYGLFGLLLGVPLPLGILEGQA
jgi:putative tricarboxylic transport membrane protein